MEKSLYKTLLTSAIALFSFAISANATLTPIVTGTATPGDTTSISGTTTITYKSSDESATKANFVEFKVEDAFPNLDFESAGTGTGWAWVMDQNGTNPAMEFVDNPSSVAPNTSATVAKFTAEDAGTDWALVWTDDVGTFSLDADHAIVKVMVYKTVISNVGVKFEGAAVKEILVPNTKINEWEELTFDFSSVIGTSFSRFVFIPDFAPRDQENIIYWDNFTFSDGSNTAINDLKAMETFVAYPNPTTGLLNIDAEENTMVSVYDLSGRLQKQAYISNGHISIVDLNEGVYLVKSDNKVARIVKR